MPRYEVVRIMVDGANLLIVPQNPSFGSKSDEEKQLLVAGLQVHAESAGLVGTVVPIWVVEGKMRFFAPSHLRDSLSDLTWEFILMNINDELTW